MKKIETKVIKEDILKEIRDYAENYAQLIEEGTNEYYWTIKNALEEGEEPNYRPDGMRDAFKENLNLYMWDEWEKQWGMSEDDIIEIIGTKNIDGYKVIDNIIYKKDKEVWDKTYERVKRQMMLEKSEKYRQQAEGLFDYEEDDENLFYAKSDDYDFNYCDNYSLGWLNVEEYDEEDYEITFSSNETKVKESVYVAKEDWSIENIQIALYELNKKIVDTLIEEELNDEALINRMAQRIRDRYESCSSYGETIADIDLADNGWVKEDWDELVLDHLEELAEMTGFHLWTERCVINQHLTLYIKEVE